MFNLYFVFKLTLICELSEIPLMAYFFERGWYDQFACDKVNN